MAWDTKDLQKTRFAEGLRNIANAAKQIQTAFTSPEQFLKMPRHLTGARVYLMVGGELIGLATNFSWSISNQVEEITSVDNHIPFEIVPTTFSIRASITQIVDASDSPESQGLWANMSSSQHQPLMEITVYDKLGTQIVSLRGMPERITTSIQPGQLTTRNVSFVGSIYTHNTTQQFKPYDESEFANKLRGIGDKVSSATKGIL